MRIPLQWEKLQETAVTIVAGEMEPWRRKKGLVNNREEWKAEHCVREGWVENRKV